MSIEDGDPEISHRPSLFVLPTTLALAGAIFAAVETDGPAPAVALREEWLHRVEVGMLVFALLYVLGIILWLAWHGRALPSIPLPGVGDVPIPADGDLDAAAQDLDAVVEETQGRLDRQTDALRRLATRVAALEEQLDQSSTGPAAER